MSSDTNKSRSKHKQKDTKIKKLIKGGGRSNVLGDFNELLKRAAKGTKK